MANVFLFLQIKANCSPRSLKKSVVSDLIVIQANRLQKKQFDRKILFFHMFLTVFPLFMPKSKYLPSVFEHSLFFTERLEWLAPIALFKRVTESDSLRSLMTKEWREQFTLFEQQIALLLTKTSELLKNKWANSQHWFLFIFSLKI